jgi:integrase
MTPTKFHPENERIKRAYFSWLQDSQGKVASSVDQIAAAIADFEKFTRHQDFKRFHIEQAKAYKASLGKQISKSTGKPLAVATVHSRLMDIKAFFKYLADRSGYKSKISFADCEYFNPSANDTRIAKASRERDYPSLEQIKHVLTKMPATTDFQRRDQAIIATALLTGARDDALASLSIKHFDFSKRQLFQDAKEVRTKRRKTMLTDFFPVGEEVEAIVKAWINLLITEKLFGPNDPAFPPSERGIGKDGLFTVIGFRRAHWKNADAIRQAFKTSFESVGLPYFHPHSVRHTLAMLGETQCIGPESFKSWSQNLGHDKVMTTFSSYGPVSSHRQTEILKSMQVKQSNPAYGEPDPETVANVLAYLQRKAS